MEKKKNRKKRRRTSLISIRCAVQYTMYSYTYTGLQKLDVEQTAQLERYVQALQYLNKQLAHLVGSYENISEVQHVLQVRSNLTMSTSTTHPPASFDPVPSIVPPITLLSLSLSLSLSSSIFTSTFTHSYSYPCQYSTKTCTGGGGRVGEQGLPGGREPEGEGADGRRERRPHRRATPRTPARGARRAQQATGNLTIQQLCSSLGALIIQS